MIKTPIFYVAENQIVKLNKWDFSTPVGCRAGFNEIIPAIRRLNWGNKFYLEIFKTKKIAAKKIIVKRISRNVYLFNNNIVHNNRFINRILNSLIPSIGKTKTIYVKIKSVK